MGVTPNIARLETGVVGAVGLAAFTLGQSKPTAYTKSGTYKGHGCVRENKNYGSLPKEINPIKQQLPRF